MAELKPCPFCDSRDVGVGFKLPEFGKELTHFVVCNTCGSRTANFRRKDNAVTIWNGRAEDGNT